MYYSLLSRIPDRIFDKNTFGIIKDLSKALSKKNYKNASQALEKCTSTKTRKRAMKVLTASIETDPRFFMHLAISACEQGHTYAVKLLLARYRDVTINYTNETATYFYSALCKAWRIACEQGHVEIIKLFLETFREGKKGRNITSLLKYKNFSSDDSSFIDVCRTNQHTILALLLEEYKRDRSIIPEEYFAYGVYHAFINGHAESVILLLQSYLEKFITTSDLNDNIRKIFTTYSKIRYQNWDLSFQFSHEIWPLLVTIFNKVIISLDRMSSKSEIIAPIIELLINAYEHVSEGDQKELGTFSLEYLYIACKYGLTNMVKKLLAIYNKENSLCSVAINQAFSNAFRNHHKELFISLLTFFSNERDTLVCTLSQLLTECYFYNSPKSLRFLIEACGNKMIYDAIVYNSFSGFTKIFEKDNQEIIAILLEVIAHESPSSIWKNSSKIETETNFRAHLQEVFQGSTIDLSKITNAITKVAQKTPYVLAAELFSLGVLISDGYLEPGELAKGQPTTLRFFKIFEKLSSMDPQTSLCNRAYGKAKDIINLEHRKAAFNKFAPTIEPSQTPAP